MKRFMKVLLINFVISLFEALVFAFAVGLASGTWSLVLVIILSNVFTLTQTLFITVKYLFASGQIELGDD